MAKPKRVKANQEKNDRELRDTVARELIATLWGMKNNYLDAVCELIVRAKDSDSKVRQEQLQNAIEMGATVDELMGVINSNGN
jgi:hypothetical protein